MITLIIDYLDKQYILVPQASRLVAAQDKEPFEAESRARAYEQGFIQMIVPGQPLKNPDVVPTEMPGLPVGMYL